MLKLAQFEAWVPEVSSPWLQTLSENSKIYWLILSKDADD